MITIKSYSLKNTLTFPIQISIKWGRGERSLRTLHDLDEFDSYISNKEIANSIISKTSFIKDCLYIDAIDEKKALSFH